MNDYSNDTRGMSTLTGFALGALVGAGLALLFAPATGVDTRKRLGSAARRLRSEARGKLEAARDTASHVAGDLGEVATHMSDDVKTAIGAGQEAFREGREKRHNAAGTRAH
jgi:gas vesicle protein